MSAGLQVRSSGLPQGLDFTFKGRHYEISFEGVSGRVPGGKESHMREVDTG
jgi:hypothetical protein